MIKKFLVIIPALIIVMITLFSVLYTYNVKAEETPMTEKKVLVAYFSATGTTEKLANKIAKITGADLFEITPEQPYTADDLNWMNKESRSSVEMNDRNCRPAISSKIEDISRYDVIFVGFPVWWYREPSIIDTFMESYDFSGKTVVPFATSGGSPIGDSGKNMQKLAPKAKVYAGKCFSVTVPEGELESWIKEMLSD